MRILEMPKGLIPGLTIVRKPLETYLCVRDADGDRELTARECEILYGLASSGLADALIEIGNREARKPKLRTVETPHEGAGADTSNPSPQKGA